MPLVDVSLIDKVPFAFFTDVNDQVCLHETANEFIPKFKTQTTQIDVPDADHYWFVTKANSDWFIQNLIEQLQIPNQANQFLQ